MNLIEYLIQEDALGNQSKRSSIAVKILRAEIAATVAIYPPGMSADAGTSALIRQALRQPSKPRYVSPLDSAQHKAELLKFAARQDADLGVLRQIDLCEAPGENRPNDSQKPHIAYLKTVIDKLGNKATWKVIQKTCLEANDYKHTPFTKIDGCLALKTDEKTVSDKTFQNWITIAKNVK